LGPIGGKRKRKGHEDMGKEGQATAVSEGGTPACKGARSSRREGLENNKASIVVKEGTALARKRRRDSTLGSPGNGQREGRD